MTGILRQLIVANLDAASLPGSGILSGNTSNNGSIAVTHSTTDPVTGNRQKMVGNAGLIDLTTGFYPTLTPDLQTVGANQDLVLAYANARRNFVIITNITSGVNVWVNLNEVPAYDGTTRLGTKLTLDASVYLDTKMPLGDIHVTADGNATIYISEGQDIPAVANPITYTYDNTVGETCSIKSMQWSSVSLASNLLITNGGTSIMKVN